MNVLQIGPGPRLKGLLAGVLGLTLWVLLGCGGGSSSTPTPTPTPTPPPAWLTGVWTGTNSATGGLGRLLVLPSGRMMVMDGTTLNQLDGTLSVTGATLSGSATSFQVATSTTGNATFSGTAAQSPASMNLTASANGGSSSSSFNLTPDSNANVAVTPAQVAGNYTSLALANSADKVLTAVVAASGSGLTVTLTVAPGQSLPITFTQVASGLNAFALDTSVAGQAETSGLAYYNPAQGTTAASLVVMMNNGAKALQGVFTYTGVAYSGIWSGTTTLGSDVTAVVLPTGGFQAFLRTSTPDFGLVKGNLTLSGTTLGGTGQAITYTATGTVAENPATIGGTYQAPQLAPKITASNLTATAPLTLTPGANVATTMANLMGSYTCPAAANPSNRPFTLNIAASGIFTLAIDPAFGGTSFTGTLVQVATGLNAFKVVLSDPELTGLVYLLPGQNGANDRVIYVMNNNSLLFGGTFTRN